MFPLRFDNVGRKSGTSSRRWLLSLNRFPVRGRNCVIIKQYWTLKEFERESLYGWKYDPYLPIPSQTGEFLVNFRDNFKNVDSLGFHHSSSGRKRPNEYMSRTCSIYWSVKVFTWWKICFCSFRLAYTLFYPVIVKVKGLTQLLACSRVLDVKVIRVANLSETGSFRLPAQ